MSTIPQSILAANGIDAALLETVRHFRAHTGTVHTLGPDGLLHLRAASDGIPPIVIEKVRTIPIGKGMAGLAVERKEPVTICNIQTDTSGDVRPGAKLTGMEGAIVVPMRQGGEVIGALGIANREERTFTPEETELLLAIGEHLAAQHG